MGDIGNKIALRFLAALHLMDHLIESLSKTFNLPRTCSLKISLEFSGSN